MAIHQIWKGACSKTIVAVIVVHRCKSQDSFLLLQNCIPTFHGGHGGGRAALDAKAEDALHKRERILGLLEKMGVEVCRRDVDGDR